MSSLSVGTQAIRFAPGEPGTLVNLGNQTVYIDTVTPNSNSTPIAPLGGLTLDGTQTYFLVAASGVQELTFLTGMTAYLPSTIQVSAILGTANVAVTNAPNVGVPGGVAVTNTPGVNVTNTPGVNVQVAGTPGVAGTARVVFSGSYTPGTSGSKTVTLLPTDRSLVVLMSTAFNNDRLAVVGNQSGTPYSPGDAKDQPLVWGWACPAYGQADTSCNFIITGTATARTVTVIAVPDELVFGETWAPQTSLLMAPGLAAFLGVLASPLAVFEDEIPGSSGGINVTTSPQNILGPPAAGFIRIVDMLTFRGGGGTTIQFRGPVGLDYDLSPPTPPLFPHWVLNSASSTITVQMASGTSVCWMSWHDKVQSIV